MKAKDILLPHKKKAKHLWSGKSYGDLNYATSDGDSATIPQLSSHDNPQRRSLSFGSGSAQLAAQRVAIGAEYPHDAMAYELLSKCGYGATAEVSKTYSCPLTPNAALLSHLWLYVVQWSDTVKHIQAAGGAFTCLHYLS